MRLAHHSNVLRTQRNSQCQVRGRPFQKGTSGNPGGRPKVLGDVQELARERSPEAINTLAAIMDDTKAPPAARVAAANSLLDRGYGKPTQPISQTLTKIDPSTMSDEELAALFGTGCKLMSDRTNSVAAAEELLRRRSTRRSFAEWAKHRGFEPAAHHRLIINEIESFLESDDEVLLLFAPPGSAKSTYVSVLLPSWYLANHPMHSILAATHNVEFAERWGRRVRNDIAVDENVLGIKLSDDSKAAAQMVARERWRVLRRWGRNRYLGLSCKPRRGR